MLGLWRLGAGTDSGSLTEHYELSNPKQSGALRFLFPFEVVGVAIEEAAEEAVNEEAAEVFGVAEDLRERLVPAGGFFRSARLHRLRNIAVSSRKSGCIIILSVPYLYIPSVFF